MNLIPESYARILQAFGAHGALTGARLVELGEDRRSIYVVLGRLRAKRLVEQATPSPAGAPTLLRLSERGHAALGALTFLASLGRRGTRNGAIGYQLVANARKERRVKPRKYTK